MARRLDSVYAPSVIAGFGSGADQVSVDVTAPHGAAAYLAALRQDVPTRKAAGAQLMANKRIEMTAQARTQLATGERRFPNIDPASGAGRRFTPSRSSASATPARRQARESRCARPTCPVRARRFRHDLRVAT